MKKGRVLIVEDDLDQIEAYRVVLEASGYDLTVAYCPAMGWDKAVGVKPDVIILDVMFGPHEKTRGMDLAVRFKRNVELRAVPLVMITSINTTYPGFELNPSDQGSMLPVDRFLEKPVSPDMLIKTIDEMIDRGESAWANWPEEA